MSWWLAEQHTASVIDSLGMRLHNQLSFAGALTCGQPGYQNKEQRGLNYNSNRESWTSCSALNTSTPLCLYI